MSKWTYFAVVSSIQGLFHKIQALHQKIQGVFKDLAVFQGVFQARANHDIWQSKIYTPSLPPCPWCQLKKFSISGDFRWTQNCLHLRFRRLPEQTWVRTIIMVILAISIHGLSLALHQEKKIALLFYWFCFNSWNAQDVRATGFELRANIKAETEYFNGYFL